MKSVFVTVGTTSFDNLIKEICSPDILQILSDLEFSQLTLQIGNGSFEPEKIEKHSLPLEWYQFKDSLEEDIKQASLVISHAGAGSILEALKHQKPLVVVVNEGLMDNHQFELARKLAQLNHLRYCTCSTLGETLKKLRQAEFTPLPPVEKDMFPTFVDQVMGYVD